MAEEHDPLRTTQAAVSEPPGTDEIAADSGATPPLEEGGVHPAEAVVQWAESPPAAALEDGGAPSATLPFLVQSPVSTEEPALATPVEPNSPASTEEPAASSRPIAERSTHPPAPGTGETGPYRAPGAEGAEIPLPEVPGYEIMGVLGQGGMGVVFKARQVGLDRVVALKMILPGGYASPLVLNRFMTEARAVARMQHPNIVQIYEIGEQVSQPYFSLEFVDGGALDKRLAGTPQPPKEAATLFLPLAQAMHAAHQQGIIHRDLKPANVLLTRDGVPKITDFGLAKQLDEDTGQTKTGQIMGTPAYMAPEQALGENRTVGPTSDIYALGVILYEMLTGRPPFKGVSVHETLIQVYTDDPVPPRRLQPKVPRDLETICLKCLEKAPPKRYGSAQALAEDVQRFLDGEPIRARPVPAWERGWKWSKRHPVRVLSLVGVVFAVLGVIGFVIFHNISLETQLAAKTEEVEKLTREQQLASLRADAQKLQHEGQDAFENKKDFERAYQCFQGVLVKIGSADELQDFRDEAQAWLKKTEPLRANREAYIKARETYDQFLHLYDDALFHEARFNGADVVSNLEAAGAAAKKALELFGVRLDNNGLPDVDGNFFNEGERTEIRMASYELLLVLAESLAGSASQPAEARGRLALEALERTAPLKIETRSFHQRRARYLAQVGDVDGAQKERSQAAKIQPVSAADHFLLGDDAYLKDDLSQASAEFDTALRLQARLFWPQYFLALCQLKQRRFQEAQSSLTACLGRRPDFTWALVLRGYAYGELGSFEAAHGDFERVLERRPEPDTWTRYGVYVHRGLTRLKQKEFDKAAADFREAIRLKPELHQAYVNLGHAHQQQEQLADALQAFDEAIQRSPEQPGLYRNRAKLHLQRKDMAAAMKDFDKALAFGPDKSSPLDLADDQLARGDLLRQARKLPEAVAAIRQALEFRADHSETHRLHGEVLLEMGRAEEAVQAFDDSLRWARTLKQPPEATVYRERGLALATLGKHAEAIRDYTEALKLQKDDVASLFGRGWALTLSNQLGPALSDFEQALRLDPKNAHAYLGRGYVRVKRGQYREAVADAEDGLKLGPKSSTLLVAAARIFSQAVARIDDARLQDAASLDLLAKYQDRAGQLLFEAVNLLPVGQRAAFWQQHLHAGKDRKALVIYDADFRPISRSRTFLELETAYGQRR